MENKGWLVGRKGIDNTCQFALSAAVRFDDSRLLDSLVYDLVLGDYSRGINRSYINDIANGLPPYPDREAEENHIVVNVNDLTHTRLMHDGRAQLFNGFMKTGNYFTCRTDFGPVHKRAARSALVTREINRPMKRSVEYFERQRSKFGQLILHGIAPGVWQNEDDWCCQQIGIEDALIPSNTLLGFRNLPVYVLRRSYTNIELQKMTCREKRDPGWNMPMVKRCLKWLDSQFTQLRNTNWPEVWAPEKVSERVKQDGGYYLGDQVPTLDVFDIYGWVDGDEDGTKESGWVRRIILDSWGAPAQSGLTDSGKPRYDMSRKSGDFWSDKNSYYGFLYSSGKKKVASDWRHASAWQFADLSAVFPARYHSIRSLGWLVYAPCHLQNRMRCKMYEAVFEALTMYFKVKDMTEAQRALKLNLVNLGFIDDTLTPLTAGERWQVNQALVNMGMENVAEVINSNSASYVQNQNFSQERTEKTKFQVMAELNATQALVGAALNQAYQYEAFEDREIMRRFMRPNSKNIDVKNARARILKADPGIEKYLKEDCWDVEHERVMGGGSKTMEMTIAQWLMENRTSFDPGPQRTILRDSVLAYTDNPDKANELVPETSVPSDSAHDAQLASGTLLLGLPMVFKEGVNHQEYAAALIGALTNQVQKMMQKGGVPTPDELNGMQNISGMTIQGQPIKGNGIWPHIQLLKEDEQSQQIAKRLTDAFVKQFNEIKGGAQRLQQAQQKAAQQNGNGQADPKKLAEIQMDQMDHQQKMQERQQSHAQRTAQRQIQFEQEMLQDRQKHDAELRQSSREHVAELAKTDLEGAANIRRNRLTSTQEEE